MTAFSDMVTEALVNLPECPQPSVEAYLRLSAIELCRRSYVWREEQAAVSKVSADFPLAITPPAGANVFQVMSVVIDGKSPALDRSDVHYEEAGTTDWRTATGTPVRYIELPHGTITLIPLPAAAVSVKPTVAYEPTMAAISIPDALYAEHGSTIISGAIAKLALIPGRPWTGADLASVHRSIFESGIRSASREFHQHYIQQPMNVAPSPI